MKKLMKFKFQGCSVTGATSNALYLFLNIYCNIIFHKKGPECNKVEASHNIDPSLLRHYQSS